VVLWGEVPVYGYYPGDPSWDHCVGYGAMMVWVLVALAFLLLFLLSDEKDGTLQVVIGIFLAAVLISLGVLLL
jgi:RsiW-degrading membrane proteinase PrsW (M82 family)